MSVDNFGTNLTHIWRTAVSHGLGVTHLLIFYRTTAYTLGDQRLANGVRAV